MRVRVSGFLGSIGLPFAGDGMMQSTDASMPELRYATQQNKRFSWSSPGVLQAVAVAGVPLGMLCLALRHVCLRATGWLSGQVSGCHDGNALFGLSFVVSKVHPLPP